MAKHRFFVRAPLVTGKLLTLEKQVSRHISSVLRLGRNQHVTLFNGQGGEYDAEITTVERKQVLVRIGGVNPVDRESPLSVRVAIALAKGDRMDYAIQKVTELGATRISPLFTSRSEVKLSKERAAKKLLHWQGITISACEQSGRNLLPMVDSPVGFQELIESAAEETKLILCPGAPLISRGARPSQVTLVTGPEGGFTESETELARSGGFLPTGFGPRVLRAETAPLAALSILQYLWGDAGENARPDY
jgi:16S rRNA (uracil1498-N3)-methyltransferase